MRRCLPILSATIAVLIVIVASSPYSSAQKNYKSWGVGGFTKYVTIPGATRAGSEKCAACHADLISNYRHAFHAQQGIECEDCHGAGSSHIDGGGDVTKIVSFRRRSAQEANGACLSCHIQDEKVRNWIASKHSSDGVRCIECHQIHGQHGAPKDIAKAKFDTSSLGRVKPVEDLVP